MQGNQVTHRPRAIKPDDLRHECDRVLGLVEARIRTWLSEDWSEGPTDSIDRVVSVLIGEFEGKSVSVEISVQPDTDDQFWND